jgi:hypothetical protein
MKHGGNASNKNIMTITASSVYDGESSHEAKNAADITSISFWYSNNEDISYLRYDFKGMQIKPTSNSSNRHIMEQTVASLQKMDCRSLERRFDWASD